MNMLIFQIIYVLLITLVAKGARILGVFHLSSYSHHQLSDRLFKELAARGHDITLITGFDAKENVTNMKTIVVGNQTSQSKVTLTNMFTLADASILSNNIKLDYFILRLVNNTLNDINVQQLIKSKEHFDIVIVERLRNDALHGFCAHFNAHCIVSISISASHFLNSQMGNSAPPSYIPELCTQFSTQMNIFERLYNSLIHFLLEIWYHGYLLPLHNELMHKHFANVPDLSDIYLNTSLMLINSHVATNPSIPLMPNMINIGGYHIKPPNPIPIKLKEYLDNSAEGVILFSMGSNLRSEDLSPEKRKVILNVFKNLSKNILWKLDEESILDQPLNVKLSKWIPQNDVLVHPNIKLFITHGGLLSTLEAIYHGIPIVGLPVFADQYSNMKIAEENGYGISVPFKYLTEENFYTAISNVLNKPKYLQTAHLRSKVFHDNPIKPLDKAIFWIEYILRQNGAPHLKSPALNLKWFQYLFLDVIAVTAFIFIIPICIYYRLRLRRALNAKNKEH